MRSRGQARTFTAAVCALAAIAVAAASASAAPQGPWVQPASDLSATGQSAFSPRVTTALDGTTTAVWYRSNGSNYIVQAATRPPGGSFGVPVDLSAVGQDASGAQVATALDGTTTAVWQRGSIGNAIIQAATRPPGGSFGTPVDLSVTGQNADHSQVTMAPDGTATAVWERFNGSHLIIQAATRPPGGSFGTPVNLSVTGENAYNAQITTAADGTTTAVWQRYNGSHRIMQAATRPPGGSFGTPVDLSATGQDAYNPQVTAAADGTTTAVWRRYNGSNQIIQAATRPPGGNFGVPVDLSATGQSAFSPQITTAPNRTTTVVWQRYNGSSYIVQAATRPPNGNFGTPVDLSATGQAADNPRVIAAPDGTVTVVWKRYNGSSYIVQAATRPPTGSFGVPIDLSATGQHAVDPQVTAAPDGSATAAWHRSNGSNSIVQAISTAQPSVTVGVAKAGTGGGTITSAPSGINCGNDCAESYPSFTKVMLTATPDPGSMFEGWGGACEKAAGNTCRLTMLDDVNVTGIFDSSPPPPPSGKARLKVTKVKPKKPRVKRGRTVKLRVTAKNTGKATAKNARLCLKLSKRVRKMLKPKGKTCRKLGSLAAGKKKTRAFRLKATGKARKGSKNKIAVKLTAKGARTATRAVRVKVR